MTTSTSIADRPETGPDAVYQLMPPLTEEERASLKEDIKMNGVTVPVIFDEDGVILDGHHRMALFYELIDEGFKIPTPPRQVARGLSEADKVERVAALNLKRRHLTREQKAKLFASLRQLGMTYQKIAEAAGGSTSVSFVHTLVKEAGGEQPEFTVGANGKQYPTRFNSWTLLTGVQVEREEKSLLKAAARATIPESMPASIEGRYTLHNLDFRDPSFATLIPDGSIDAIVSDPPYLKEHIELFEPFGKFAARVLKPGGSAVLMIGQMWFPHIVNELRKAEPDGLHYRWIMAYMLSRGHMSFMHNKVNVGWKPCVVFTKASATAIAEGRPDQWAKDAEWFFDVVKGSADESKDFHEWGQDVAGFKTIIERFTMPGDTVLDAFNGGGTTGLAALHANRYYVGIEIDPVAYVSSLNRFAEEDWSDLAKPAAGPSEELHDAD